MDQRPEESKESNRMRGCKVDIIIYDEFHELNEVNEENYLTLMTEKKKRIAQMKTENFFKTEVGKDCINLDSSLSKWLGTRMIAWADNNNSYPQEYEAEAWSEDLRKHGHALLDFSNRYSEESGCFLIRAKTSKQESKKAKKAMKWVAKNFNDLWD